MQIRPPKSARGVPGGDGRRPPRLTLLAACQATIESIVWERDWQAHFKSRGLFLFERYRDLWDRQAAHHPGVLPGLLRLD